MRYLVCIVVLAVNAFLASAQDTRGNISGTVTDSQGAAVPGATVTVANTGTGTSTRLTTNASGYYEAPLLLPGAYSVTVEASGFKKSVRSNLALGLGEQLQINMPLEIGGATESITVSSEAPMLDTSTVSTGRAMTNREVMDLPVLGNNMMMLTRLAPGVQNPGTTQFLVQGQVGGGSGYNQAGGVGGNEWSIDGASTNGTDRRVSIMPSPDTVDEFKIETSNFDASFGHATGLGISMSTKSGANEFHGTGTYQYFNQKWNAASFFVKQSRGQQIAAARAAGNTALANQLEDQPLLPPGQTRDYHATIGGPRLHPEGHRSTQQGLLLLRLVRIEESSIRAAQRAELHGSYGSNAQWRLLVAPGYQPHSVFRSTIRSPPVPIQPAPATGCVIRFQGTLFLATASITRCTISTRSACRCRMLRPLPALTR